MNVEDIRGFMQYADIVIFTGTRKKVGIAETVEVQYKKKWIICSSGYVGKSRSSQSHAGIIIALNRNFCAKKCIRSWNWASGPFQGRFLALRLVKGCADITVAGVYVPPFQGTVHDTTHKLFEHIHKFLGSIPARTTPIFCGDWNGRVGFSKVNGKNLYVANDAVGRNGAEVENDQGRFITEFALNFGFVFANIWRAAVSGKSFCNSNGKPTSRVDYMLLPKSMQGKFTDIKLLMRKSFRMQNVHSTFQIDHIALQITHPP